ncbi:MAG: response regulator [Reyranella sp.]|nr:MAG: response regulator [Reyranella sp.]
MARLARGVHVRILLVEDDDDLRTEIREYLHRRGHEVTACGSLGDARAAVCQLIAAETLPEATVCDVNLPDGNGVDFYMTTASRLPSSRWILMSGAHDHGRTSQLAEATDGRPQCIIIEKPVSLRVLHAALG